MPPTLTAVKNQIFLVRFFFLCRCVTNNTINFWDISAQVIYAHYLCTDIQKNLNQGQFTAFHCNQYSGNCGNPRIFKRLK